MTDLNKERELYMAAKARIEKEEFFCRDWDLWKACAELKQEEINELRAELEKAKAQAVPEGFKIVPIELSEEIAERLALERVQKPRPENDPVWVEIAERAYKSNLLAKKWELVREYKILTEASESGAEG
ncbi:hypothetical protein [Acinetobacter baumannii]|uniref:hypothetical protein n=1 Tax=Acinetobacter baumannii TaxID=470 RepID=UPI001D0E2F18|nr:hypothetical protein [Acinetobacter baumannii]UDY20828.1 hypothetical protein NLHDIDDJ_02483 [Acinetobacter baumannii]